MDLIVDGPRDGSWNMAADEMLLEAAARERRPFLRLYRWSVPTWSLGRAQPWSGGVDPRFCRENGIEIVRRPTGGRGLLHQDELTYAVAAPIAASATRPGEPARPASPFPARAAGACRAIAGAIASALRALGADVELAPEAADPFRSGAGPHCFSRPAPHEITSAGGKLVGSAQRRRRDAFLQHGSIPLTRDDRLWAGAAGAPLPQGAALPSMRSVCGRPVAFEELAEAMALAFAELSGGRLRPVSRGTDDLLKIEALRTGRYLSRDWTEGRERGAA